MSADGASLESALAREWFDTEVDGVEGRPGLRFGCTMCGNCCSGPSGYVLVDDQETAALAARLKMSVQEFVEGYTHQMLRGRSLNERRREDGSLDCVFLDRESIPGRAICGVYEDRPKQCRTWPFWSSVIRDRAAWDRASKRCPGIGKGVLVSPDEIRILRDRVAM